MAKKIDPKILKIAEKYSKNGQIPITSLKRFLDDLFSIWYGSSKDLHKFFEEIHSIHPHIKFTMKHTTSNNEKPEDRYNWRQEASIPFLDTSLSLLRMDQFQWISTENQLTGTSTYWPAAFTPLIALKIYHLVWL